MSKEILADWGMSETDVITMLFQFGHFYSPEALAVELVEEKDLPRLTLDDPVTQAAIRSYQKFFKSDLDQFTMRAESFGGFRRESVADGKLDEPAVELLTMPRCGVPDYAHPEAEQANWPDSCRNEITTSYRMTLPGVNAAQLEALWREADGHWEKEFQLSMPLRLSDYPNTRIFAFAANLPGSVLADQYLATGNCGSRLQGRFDIRDWTSTLLVTTIAHEHGHALGLGHLNNNLATMYPSITNASMSRRGAPHSSDIQAMLNLGYRRRTAPQPPPPDDTEYIVMVKSKTPMTVVT